MPRPSLIPRSHRRRLVWLAVIPVVVAAIVNVPFAVSLLDRPPGPRGTNWIDARGSEAAARGWPATPPRGVPWPDPTFWQLGGAFAYRHYDVRGESPSEGRSDFVMMISQYGWPLPVLEQRFMWWDAPDASMPQPQPGSPISLHPLGLLANPLIVGLSLWAIIAVPWTAAVGVRRARRMRAGWCLACGYDLAGLDTCPECGRESVTRSAGPPTGTARPPRD